MQARPSMSGRHKAVILSGQVSAAMAVVRSVRAVGAVDRQLEMAASNASAVVSQSHLGARGCPYIKAWPPRFRATGRRSSP